MDVQEAIEELVRMSALHNKMHALHNNSLDQLKTLYDLQKEEINGLKAEMEKLRGQFTGLKPANPCKTTVHPGTSRRGYPCKLEAGHAGPHLADTSES